MTDSVEQSPSLEDGYLRIANELFDAILRFGFTHRQQSVLLAIIRKTYGYGKKRDDMSAAQLGELCGIARNHVTEALKDLEAMRVIEKWDGQYGCVIGINKRHKEWLPADRAKKAVPLPRREPAPPSISASPPSVPAAPPSIAKEAPSAPARPAKRRNPGLAAFKARFDEFWEVFGYKHGKTRAMKAWLAICGDVGPDADLETLAGEILRAAEIEARRRPTLVATGRTPIYPQGWLSQRRWEDEGLLSWGQWTPEEQAFVEVFNQNIGDACPHVTEWTEKRSELTKVAAAGKMTLEKWGAFWRYVRDRCEFGFAVSYEWFLRRENFAAVADGQYQREAA